MHNRNYLLVIIFLIMIGTNPWTLPLYSPAWAVESIKIPPPLFNFQSAPGSDIATRYCLICHSAEYVYMQPPHSRQQWGEIVQKMKHVFGCPVPDEQIPSLVDYLVNQNTVQPEPRSTIVQKDAPQQNIGNGDPSRGKGLYDTYCTNCHGATGQGDGPIGPSLVPPAADLTLTRKKSDKELLNVIRKGRPGTAMPSWNGDLSDAEIQDVFSYVRALSQ